MYASDFRHYKWKGLSQLIDDILHDKVICIGDY